MIAKLFICKSDDNRALSSRHGLPTIKTHTILHLYPSTTVFQNMHVLTKIICWDIILLNKMFTLMFSWQIYSQTCSHTFFSAADCILLPLKRSRSRRILKTSQNLARFYEKDGGVHGREWSQTSMISMKSVRVMLRGSEV